MSMTNVVRPSAIGAVAVALLLALSLSGCGETKRALGFEKTPPDEFQVVQRAPLTMPPDFSLRPPSPGAVRPQESTTRDQARQALIGSRQVTPIATQGRTSGDMALLKRAGAENIQPDIRSLVNKETLALADSEKSFGDNVIFWRKPEPHGEILNPSLETQRLRQNLALGKSLSDGETPLIVRRKKGWLEGVFE